MEVGVLLSKMTLYIRSFLYTQEALAEITHREMHANLSRKTSVLVFFLTNPRFHHGRNKLNTAFKNSSFSTNCRWNNQPTP